MMPDPLSSEAMALQVFMDLYDFYAEKCTEDDPLFGMLASMRAEGNVLTLENKAVLPVVTVTVEAVK